MFRAARMLFLAAAAGLALPPPALAACDLTGPAMLDLYLAGRDVGDSIHEALLRSTAGTSPVASVREFATLDAAVNSLNTHLWGLYWIGLYSRRLHEVLEQVDAAREVAPIGSVRGYYRRWDVSQIATSAALAVRAAESVSAALTRAEAAAARPLAEAVKLRQYVARTGTALQGCAKQE